MDVGKSEHQPGVPATQGEGPPTSRVSPNCLVPAYRSPLGKSRSWGEGAEKGYLIPGGVSERLQLLMCVCVQ